MFKQDGIYLTSLNDTVRLLHIEGDDVLQAYSHTPNSPTAGMIYQGRISQKAGNKYWVDIGLAKPALLQKAIHPYQEGDSLLVQLRRPPLPDAFITKNAEVTDRLVFETPTLKYLPGKSNVNFAGNLKDKQWRAEIAPLITPHLQKGEGILITQKAHPEALLKDLAESRATYQAIHQTGKAGTIVYTPLPAWVLYTQEAKSAVFTDQSDIHQTLQSAHISPQHLEFMLKGFPKSTFESTWQNLLEPLVQAGTSGYLLIEESHTLTAVDMNTGTLDQTAQAPLTDAALLELCKRLLNLAIQQLYVRKIGGIVLIDFPMLTTNQQKKLLKEANTYEDADLQILGFTKAGLLEITKRKKEPSLKQLQS